MHDDAISTTPTRTEEDPNLTKRGIYKYNPPIPDDPNSSHYIDHGLPGWLKDSRSGRIHVPVIYDNAVTLDPPAWVWAGKHGPDTPQNQSLEPSPTIERPWTSACLDQTTFDDSTTHAFCPSTLHSTPTVSPTSIPVEKLLKLPSNQRLLLPGRPTLRSSPKSA
jgi:hypothetical protein